MTVERLLERVHGELLTNSLSIFEFAMHKLAHPLLGNFETDGEHALIERTRGRAIVVD